MSKTMRTEPQEQQPMDSLNPKTYTCYRVGQEVGMVEEAGGVWVPTMAFTQMRSMYLRAMERIGEMVCKET